MSTLTHYRSTWIHTFGPMSQFRITVHTATSIDSEMIRITGPCDGIAFTDTPALPRKHPHMDTLRVNGDDQGSREVSVEGEGECSHLGELREIGPRDSGTHYLCGKGMLCAGCSYPRFSWVYICGLGLHAIRASSKVSLQLWAGLMQSC
jgi:hypothetical protein